MIQAAQRRLVARQHFLALRAAALALQASQQAMCQLWGLGENVSVN